MSRLAKLAIATLLLATGSQARAAFTVTYNQVGGDVVATASGSLNTAALGVFNPGTGGAGIGPFVSYFGVGQASDLTFFNAYYSGPSSIGPGGFQPATNGTGILVSVEPNGPYLAVTRTYVSGSAITSTATFQNQTFASLGLNVGNYNFSYAATRGGQVVDTITVNVVPEPASLAMVGLGLAGLAVFARRRRA